MWGGGEVGDTKNMNIQVPLLLLGITATAGAGVGTIAANTGGFSIDDLNALTNGVTSTIQTPADILVPVLEGPGAPVPTPTTPVDGITSVTDGGSQNAGSTTQVTSASNTVTTVATNGTSSGSASGGTSPGSYEDDADDSHEDHHDESEDNETDDD